MRFIQCLTIFHTAYYSYGDNILIADHSPSPSHQIWHYAIAEALLERGHNITMLGPPPPIKPVQHKNFHHLTLGDMSVAVIKNINIVEDNFDGSALQTMIVCHRYCFQACKEALKTEGLKMLLNYPEEFKFDIILIDLTCKDCFLPLIQRFNYPPTVGLSVFLIPAYLSLEFGNELSLSYIPSFYTSYSTDMNFVQRLKNYLCTYIDIRFREFFVRKPLNNLMTEIFGDHMDSLHNLNNHVSLLLVNWNPILNPPQGITPNIIPVGGLHVRPQKLPKDIQEIMDKAQNGVILFSLGTNFKSANIKPNGKQAIINAFSKLNQTVLWKFETDITGLPKNVIVRNWLPQIEILAHPNIKLFISHSGGLSTVEATHFGIPMLGLPLIVDQHTNIENLVGKGVARKLDRFNFTEEIFLENINELLYNDTYAKKMKALSRRIRDQPQTPMDTAVFWIEYAIRHNGTHFLNPKSRNMSLFVTSSTDIHLFIVLVLCVVIYIFMTLYSIIKSILVKNVKKHSKLKIN